MLNIKKVRYLGLTSRFVYDILYTQLKKQKKFFKNVGVG